MSDQNDVPEARLPVVRLPGEGRHYPMGAVFASFKADGQETANTCAVSEWWLDAQTAGPGAHAHPEDDLFYVIEGTMSFLIKDVWQDLPRGSFVLVPGGFEPAMPEIVDWYQKYPARRLDDPGLERQAS